MEGPVILYVDDEEINLLLFKMSFSKNFNIITSVSPIKALEIVKENEIKVVISDYKMPYMNGMELIRETKRVKPDIICMILSAYAESEVTIQKELLYKYILKPWNKNDFINVLNEALATLKPD